MHEEGSARSHHTKWTAHAQRPHAQVRECMCALLMFLSLWLHPQPDLWRLLQKRTGEAQLNEPHQKRARIISSQFPVINKIKKKKQQQCCHCSFPFSQQSSHCFDIHANSWHHCFITVRMEQSLGYALSHDIGFILTVNEVHNMKLWLPCSNGKGIGY